MKILITVISAFIFLGCKTEKQIDAKAYQILSECIKTHGGENYNNLNVGFDFRKFKVEINQNPETYIYSRSQKDSLGNTIKDILTQKDFQRKINDKVQNLSAKDQDKYREATNSIVYFVLLPSKLNDKAVNFEYVGSTQINSEKYDKLKVWFDKEGGGKDHDDIFCYWINQKTHTLDYLAYDNGGPRFRKATKRQKISGIIVQDYENYEILDKTSPVSTYDSLFTIGKSKLLSKIENENLINLKEQ